MTKIRATLYIDGDLHERLKVLTETVPGMTISGTFNDLVREFLPVIEGLVDMAREGNIDAQAEMMEALLAQQLVGLMKKGMPSVRQLGEPGEMKE